MVNYTKNDSRKLFTREIKISDMLDIILKKKNNLLGLACNIYSWKYSSR